MPRIVEPAVEKTFRIWNSGLAVVGVAARHAHVTQNELREEREIESDKDDKSRKLGPSFRVETPGYFGPPEMHPAEVAHHGAADHDVVKMGNDEIGVV